MPRQFIVGPQPDRLDRIARTIYGTETAGAIEALLSANPELAQFPALIPVGTVVVAPENALTDADATVRPWI